MTDDGDRREGVRQRRLWMAGLRLDPNFSAPDMYMLLTDEPPYAPLMYEGQIILFRQPTTAQQVLSFHARNTQSPSEPAPGELDLDLVLDFAQGFYLLTSGGIDRLGSLLKTINVLLDALAATKVKVPPMYRACLHELADQLTFSKDLDVLFQNEALDRAESIEALQWGLGAMMSKAMFFPKPGMDLGEE